MNNKKIKIHKMLVLASLVAVLSACGGSDDGGGGDNGSGGSSSSNFPPVLDTGIVPEPSLVTANPETGCVYEDTEEADIKQLSCTFHESNIFNTGDGVSSHFDVDMRVGITDADATDALSISNLRFLWEGIDCYAIRFNTVTLEDNPQCGNAENIDELIAALPMEDRAEYEDMNTEEKLERFRLRSSQQLPKFDDRGYGFEQQRFAYRVIPSQMAPLLREGQFTAIHMQYDVSDGTDSITRRLYIRINGESSAPVNRRPQPGDDGYAVNFSFGKDPNDTVDLLAGITDPDIEADEALEEEVGSIASLYRFEGDYQPQRLRIDAVRVISGTTEGVGYSYSADAGTITIQPGDFEGLGVFERRVLKFEYDVSDGDPLMDNAQSTTVIFEYVIVGTDPVANPPYFEDDIFLTVGDGDNEIPWGANFNFNLFAGARDPDGDTISVSSIDFGGDDGVYGIDVSAAGINGTVALDTVPFLTIPEGEVRDVIITYTMTDGALEADERTATIRFKGHARNMLKNAGADYSFESGVLNIGAPETAGQWSYGWSADGAATDMVDVGGVMRPVQAVLDASSGLMPYAGDHFLYTSPGWSTSVLRTESLPLGFIEPDARYYVSYWAKASSVWSDLNVGISSSNNWDAREIKIKTPVNGTSEWKEHTGYFEGDDSFDNLTATSFWFQSGGGNEVLYDNVSIVRYYYNPTRDFAGPQLFEGTSTGSWEVMNAAAGNVNLTSAAGFNGGQGLEIDTTSQTDTVVVRLPADAIPDGAIQQGGRFRVEFDMRFFTHPEDGQGSSNATVTAAFYDTATPTTRMQLSNFLNSSSWIHMDYTFNVDVLNTGDVDWANTDVGFQIEFNKPDQTFYIDNVRIYQVP